MNPSESGCVSSSHPKRSAVTAAKPQSFCKTEEETIAPAGPYRLRFLRKMGAEVKQNSGFLLRRAMEGEQFTQLSKDFSQKANL